MSKNKTPMDPKNQRKAQQAAQTSHRNAPNKGRPTDDDDDRRKPSTVQVVGTAIMVSLLALSLVISVITPFFMR